MLRTICDSCSLLPTPNLLSQIPSDRHSCLSSFKASHISSYYYVSGDRVTGLGNWLPPLNVLGSETMLECFQSQTQCLAHKGHLVSFCGLDAIEWFLLGLLKFIKLLAGVHHHTLIDPLGIQDVAQNHT